MLNKTIIVNRIENNKEAIRKLGVVNIGLFGSYSRDEQNEKSDIDIHVEFDSEKETFDNFINLCFLLDELYPGKKVEVITKGSLSPFIEPKILSKVQYARLPN